MNKSDIYQQLAQQHQVSSSAVETLAEALQRGNLTMAQFNHPDLGGMGQWMQGGMTMVGDMFNNHLKYTVENLCQALVNAMLQNPQMFAPVPSQSSAGMGQHQWWGMDLGVPASSGSQNNSQYAYFPTTNRLAIGINGVVKVYDTTGYYITGFSQQQSDFSSMSFQTSQGLVYVYNLREL